MVKPRRFRMTLASLIFCVAVAAILISGVLETTKLIRRSRNLYTRAKYHAAMEKACGGLASNLDAAIGGGGIDPEQRKKWEFAAEQYRKKERLFASLKLKFTHASWFPWVSTPVEPVDLLQYAEYPELSPSDWTEQKYARESPFFGAVFRRSKFIKAKIRSELLPIHCEFCWRKFTDDDDSESPHDGYTTNDGERWICPRCFDLYQVDLHMSICSDVKIDE